MANKSVEWGEEKTVLFFSPWMEHIDLASGDLIASMA
jgi:hypothetical protein